MHTINWYPGHMAKARRMLEDNLKLVDMIIEIVDARAPMACRNPDFEALSKTSCVLLFLIKVTFHQNSESRMDKLFCKAGNHSCGVYLNSALNTQTCN